MGFRCSWINWLTRCALERRAIWRSTGAPATTDDFLLKGFTVSQVVHDYGDVCQTITELAVETNAPIGTADFRMLNQCLDEAIASAVTIYARESQQSGFDADRGSERMGFSSMNCGTSSIRRSSRSRFSRREV